MASKLVVVEEAFAGRGPGVLVAPRITIAGEEAGGPRVFPVRLRLPDGSERALTATLDVAHVRGPNGAFAMVRLLGVTAEDVPAGAEIWRD